MKKTEQLELVAWKLQREMPDIRQGVLEISDAFLSATADTDRFPGGLRDEILDIRAEIQAVQPTFPSKVRTSVLFDRAGAGKPGYDRAERLAQRIIAVCRTLLQK